LRVRVRGGAGVERILRCSKAFHLDRTFSIERNTTFHFHFEEHMMLN